MSRSFLSSRNRVEAEIVRFISNSVGLIGNLLFVDYQHGHDNSGNGYSIRRPLKTLEYAYSLTKNANNDVVCVLGSATSTGGTSQYISTELTWANSLTHLIGIGAPAVLNGRVRVAHISSFTADAGTLFTLSGTGCLIENITFYDGVTHADRIAMSITGNENKIKDCSILGLCGALAAADAGSSCLLISGGQENTILNTHIGTNTVLRSAANANIRLRSQAARNSFENVVARCYTSAAGSLLVDADQASAISREQMFKGFQGINIPTGLETSATNLTVAVKINASSSGVITFDPTSSFVGCAKVATNSPARVYVASPVPTAGTSGLSVVAA